MIIITPYRNHAWHYLSLLKSKLLGGEVGCQWFHAHVMYISNIKMPLYPDSLCFIECLQASMWVVLQFNLHLIHPESESHQRQYPIVEGQIKDGLPMAVGHTVPNIHLVRPGCIHKQRVLTLVPEEEDVLQQLDISPEYIPDFSIHVWHGGSNFARLSNQGLLVSEPHVDIACHLRVLGVYGHIGDVSFVQVHVIAAVGRHTIRTIPSILVVVMSFRYLPAIVITRAQRQNQIECHDYGRKLSYIRHFNSFILLSNLLLFYLVALS